MRKCSVSTVAISREVTDTSSVTEQYRHEGSVGKKSHRRPNHSLSRSIAWMGGATTRRRRREKEGSPSTTQNQHEEEGEEHECGIHGYEHAPEWVRDNEYILSGYRVRYSSVGKALRSVFHIHNETLNIWTHLLGGIFVLFMTVYTLAYTSPHGWDRVVELRSRIDAGGAPGNVTPGTAAVAAAFADAAQRLDSASADAAEALRMPRPEDKGADSIYFAETAGTAARAHPECANLELFDRLGMCPDQPALYIRSAYFRDTHMVLGSLLEDLDAMAAALAHGSKAIHEAYHDSVLGLGRGVRSLRAAVSDVCPTCGDSINRAERVVDELVLRVEALNAGGRHALKGKLTSFSRSLDTVSDGFSLLRVFSPHEHKHGVLEYLEQWPLAVFMLSAVFCMLCSAAYHTLLAVSPNMSARMQRLDFAGICLLITGSSVPIIYYGFFCSSRYLLVYLGVIVLTGVVGFCLCMSEWFGRPEHRVTRAVVFVTMASSGVLPLVHMLVHHDEVLDIFYSLLLMGVLYLSGAVLYASRFPERCSPGSFDTCGSSHQIFHVLVFMAVIALYAGLTDFYEWRLLHHCPAPSM